MFKMDYGSGKDPTHPVRPSHGRLPAAPGVHYTPRNIVDLIVRNTLGRLCEERAPEELKVLDPSCGAGAFLAGAYSYLLDWPPPNSDKRRILQDCIHGVEIDAHALEETRDKLFATLGGTTRQIDLGSNLRLGDSLLGIDWRREFPRAMERGGFDAVIGNPPWVSLSGRFGKAAYSPAEVERLRSRFGGNSYMPNLFEYFIALGLELTRPGGYLSFIVPDRLAFNRQFADLRRRLLAEGELLLLVRGIPFPGVVADTLVFVFRKGSRTGTGAVQIRDSRGTVSTYPQPRFIERPGGEFIVVEDTAINRLIAQMESAPDVSRTSGPVLGEVCDSTSGFGGKSTLITKDRVGDAQIPVLKGSSIDRYVIRETYWFDFRKENITGRTVDRAKLGASPKILIRKTGERLVAAYDDSGIFPEQSLYFLFNSRFGLDLRFILAILNSRPMNLYYRARCLTNRRSFAQAKKKDLDRIPIPRMDLSDPTDRALYDRLVELVERMFALHCRLVRTPTESGHLLSEISSTDRQIDEGVCRLYGLDPEDVERATRCDE